MPAILLTLSIGALAAPLSLECNAGDPDRAHLMLQLTDQLIADGFEVKQDVHMSFNKTCYPEGLVPKHIISDLTCWGENPSSPYGMYMTSDLASGAKGPLWHLANDSAMVFLGCTPPTSRYFGVQSYVMVSNNTMVFAGLGDPINQLSINTSDPNKEGPFNKETAIITTADQNLNMYLRKVLTALGVGERINTDALPAPHSIGIDPMGGSAIGHSESMGHSIFSTLFRVAACENKTACKSYCSTVWPVLRITPKLPKQPRFFGAPALKHRGTGTDESHLQPSIDELISRVILQERKHAGPKLVLISQTQLLPLNYTGFECIRKGINCLGEWILLSTEYCRQLRTLFHNSDFDESIPRRNLRSRIHPR
jgi:hypothetical protein